MYVHVCMCDMFQPQVYYDGTYATCNYKVVKSSLKAVQACDKVVKVCLQFQFLGSNNQVTSLFTKLPHACDKVVSTIHK